MSDKIKDRSSSILIGLAIGEALSWSSMYSRSQSLPKWLNRIRAEIDSDKYRYNVTSSPVPFTLNQSIKPLLPVPSEITEWSTWTALLLIENKGELTEPVLLKAWQELAEHHENIHGRISVQAALRNIRKGLGYPQCGRFNPHYFDDAALFRAAMIGAVYAGNSLKSTEIAELDAAFTQYEDGIYCARAIAKAISYACCGSSVSDIISGTIDELPEGSLSRRIVKKALDCTREMNDVLEIVVYLSREICNLEYSYGNIAHEILACVLSIINKTKGNFDQSVSMAALVAKPGACLMAICTALASAIDDYGWRQKIWIDSKFSKLNGAFIPSMKDVDIRDIAMKIGDLSTNLTVK